MSGADDTSWFTGLTDALGAAVQYGNLMMANPVPVAAQAARSAVTGKSGGVVDLAQDTLNLFQPKKGNRYYAWAEQPGVMSSDPSKFKPHRILVKGRDAQGNEIEDTWDAQAFIDAYSKNPDMFKGMDAGKAADYMTKGAENLAYKKVGLEAAAGDVQEGRDARADRRRGDIDMGLRKEDNKGRVDATKLTADASKHGADVAAGASKYGADAAADASKHGADAAAGASRYQSDILKDIEGIRDATEREKLKVQYLQHQDNMGINKGYLGLSARQLEHQQADSERDYRMLLFAMIGKGLDQALEGMD